MIAPLDLLRQTIQTVSDGGRLGREIDRAKALMAVGIGLGLALLSIWQAGPGKWDCSSSWPLPLRSCCWEPRRVLVLCAMKNWPRPEALVLRQALGNVVRPGSQAVSITIAIGIAVMVVTTVSLVERSLLAQVGDNRPTDAPTFFFIDIQPDQAEGMAALLRQRSSDPNPRLTPLVRSRLSASEGGTGRRLKRCPRRTSRKRKPPRRKNGGRSGT